MLKNFIAIVQQKQFNYKEELISKEHCMLPEIVIDFMAQLPNKPQASIGGFITSGKIVTILAFSDPLHPYKISNLPVGTKNSF